MAIAVLALWAALLVIYSIRLVHVSLYFKVNSIDTDDEKTDAYLFMLHTHVDDDLRDYVQRHQNFLSRIDSANCSLPVSKEKLTAEFDHHMRELAEKYTPSYQGDTKSDRALARKRGYVRYLPDSLIPVDLK